MLMAGTGVGAGFGSGWRSGDALEGVIGGGRSKIVGVSALGSAAGRGVILGGRRIGVTGVRLGKTMRVVSVLGTFGAVPACSGPGGNAIRVVSFFGSAMRGGGGYEKSHKPPAAVTEFLR